MLDLQSLLLFEAIATHGSLTAASRALAVPKATLSRKLSELEREVGVRLVQRTTRSMTLTEAGALLHERTERVAAEVTATQTLLDQLHGGVRGTLRVAADPAVGRLLLSPLLPDFLVTHPDLRLDVRLSGRSRDPVRERVDVLLAPRDLTQTTLVSRRLWSIAMHVYASPAYLSRRRAPSTPEDLSRHQVLAFTDRPSGGRVTWELERGDERRDVPLSPVLTADEPTPLIAGALAGRGLTLVADWMVTAEVSAGRLVQVLPDWHGPEVNVRLYLPARQGQPPKVRAFVDYLASRLGKLPPTPTPQLPPIGVPNRMNAGDSSAVRTKYRQAAGDRR